MNKAPRLTEYGLLLLILGVAAYLRMGWPDVIEFKRDEANLSILALDFAHGRIFPLLGITSSIGFPNAPVNAYILAIPYWFSSSPVIATQFIGLLNVIGVGLAYVFVRRYTGAWIALGIALLLAVSPWGVIFSRKIWAQNMLPPFIIATIFTGILAFKDNKKWAHIVHPALLVITGQIHYGAFVIIPACMWLWWYGRTHISRYTFAGIAIAVMLTMPFALGMAQANLLNPGNLQQAMREASTAEESEANRWTLSSLRETGVIVAGTEIHSLAGPQEFENYLATIPDIQWLLHSLTLTLMLSVGWLSLKTLRGGYDRRTVDVAVLLWLAFPVVIYIPIWTTFYIHYLIPMLPAAFIAIGLAVQDLSVYIKARYTSRRIRAFQAITGTAVIGIATAQVFLLAALINFLGANYTPGGFGYPLGQLMAIRDTLLQHEDTHIIGRLDGQAITFDDEVTIFYALLYDAASIRFEDTQTTVYRDDAITVLSHDDGANCLPLRTRAEGCYVIEQREKPSFNDIERILPNTFANGVQIIGYNWEDSSNCIDLHWRITTQAKRDYTFSVHGYTADDERNNIADGLSWPSVFWLAGDYIVRRYCLAQPPAYILVGMYHLTPDGVIETVGLRDSEDSTIRLDIP